MMRKNDGILTQQKSDQPPNRDRPKNLAGVGSKPHTLYSCKVVSHIQYLYSTTNALCGLLHCWTGLNTTVHAMYVYATYVVATKWRPTIPGTSIVHVGPVKMWDMIDKN